MNFTGRALKLTSDEITLAAQMINVTEDEIHAVLDVETAGSGFDHQGRPRILFEPAYFYRTCPPDRLAEAVKKGIAYKSYGMKPYPKDSYPSLSAAIAIDEDAALRSTSWGLGQIMGNNHKVAGFDSAKEMVLAFMDSEGAQLSGMVNFVKGNHLDVALKTHNWVTFARGYNGVRYQSNHYDTRLEAAYTKWLRIPNTPLSSHQTAPEKVSRAEAPVVPETPKQAPAALQTATATTSLADRAAGALRYFFTGRL